MFKLLAVMSLCLALVASQSCTDTQSLRTLYGFGNTVTTPTAASGLNYCKSLKTGNICCTPADVNTIKTKSDAIIANLTTVVSARDKYYAANVNNVVTDLTNSLNTFSTAFSTFATKVATTTDPTTLQTLTDISTQLSGVAIAGAFLTAGFATLTPDFTGFQKARSTCIVELVQLQNAALCAACDPNAATKGYDSANVDFTLSDAVCTRLKTACYNYLNLGQYPNAVLVLRATIDSINQQTALINAINAGTAPSESAFDNIQSTVPVGADLPAGCTSATTCPFICDDLFNNGVLDQTALAFGGETEGRRRLTERSLVSGTFSPDTDESGVEVTFSQDPGNTQSKSASLSFGSVFAGMMMMISYIFLF